MKKLALVCLLLFSAFSWAATNPNLADYTINIHVNTSRLDIEFSGKVLERHQRLNVVIEGKRYELLSILDMGGVLSVGDYKAKLVKDEHRGKYDSLQIYEFLFPDNKTRQFWVVGETE